MNAPGLVGVACQGKSLCFAVGGYFGGAFGSVPLFGTILTSTNGGTFWTNVPLPLVPTANPNAATSTATPAGGTTAYVSCAVTACPLGPPGGLNAISVGSSGRNVYAVGAPALVPVTPGIPLAMTVGNLPALGAGTILYSGNSGASFVSQSAPFVPRYFYELTTVYALRGTVAFAAGGNPLWTEGSSTTSTGAAVSTAATVVPANGVIIGTSNGGFTWSVQNLPSYSYACSSANQLANGLCWNTGATTPAAYSPQGTALNGAIPVINSLAFLRQSSGAYMGWAVGNDGLVFVTSLSLPGATGGGRGIITSWTQAAMGAAFASMVQLPTGFQHLIGIVWDNAQVGYIYGKGIILSTHNAGATWVVDAPTALLVSSGASINALAVVPTKYRR